MGIDKVDDYDLAFDEIVIKMDDFAVLSGQLHVGKIVCSPTLVVGAREDGRMHSQSRRHTPALLPGLVLLTSISLFFRLFPGYPIHAGLQKRADRNAVAVRLSV